MKKSYVSPSILLLPMQIVGPNAGVSGEGGMKPIDAKEGSVDEDFDMSAGWDE